MNSNGVSPRSVFSPPGEVLHPEKPASIRSQLVVARVFVAAQRCVVGGAGLPFDRAVGPRDGSVSCAGARSSTSSLGRAPSVTTDRFSAGSHAPISAGFRRRRSPLSSAAVVDEARACSHGQPWPMKHSQSAAIAPRSAFRPVPARRACSFERFSLRKLALSVAARSRRFAANNVRRAKALHRGLQASMSVPSSEQVVARSRRPFTAFRLISAPRNSRATSAPSAGPGCARTSDAARSYPSAARRTSGTARL